MPAYDREKWNDNFARKRHASKEPSSFVVESVATLPQSGRALDVAGGAGRNGLWLAECGFDVTIVDISSVGLGIAEQRAEERGLHISTLERDLAEAGLPPGPWDLIVSVLYLQRSLLAQLPAVLRPGGHFVMLQPTVRNLERHAKPPRPFLLEEGELRQLLPAALEPIVLDESWSEGGHHEARLLAHFRTIT